MDFETHVSAELKDIKEKLEAWPDKCEEKRGHVHERINRLYFWMLGGQGLIAGLILYLKYGGA